MTDTTETPDPNDPWPVVREVFEWMRSLFGTPSEIARNRVETARFHKGLAIWVHAIETLLRRLLLLAARHVDVSNLPPPRPAARKTAPSAHGRGGFASDDAADWGVSFKLGVPVHKKHKRGRRAPRRRFAFMVREVCALAERYEAALRVVANPTPYIVRMARRMKRDKHFASRIANEPLRKKDPLAEITTDITLMLWRFVPETTLPDRAALDSS